MRAPFSAVLAASLACLTASTCAGIGPGRGGEGLAIVAYNAHNVFDAVDDGPEYAEFSVARGRWDDARYRSRLAGVAKALGAALPDGAWPDLVCLEEIENRAVLEALAAGPCKAAGYGHFAMAPAPGSPINCGIMSRLPILSVRAHALASGPASKAAPSPPSRSLLEARVDSGGGAALTVFVVHWKSKLEGAEATEGARRQAAALLAERVRRLLAEDPLAAVVVCGDFNENPDELARVGRRYPTALVPESFALDPRAGAAGDRLLVAAEPGRAGRTPGGETVFYSPWAAESGYSYSYRGERERIDGFLLSPGLVDGEGLDFRGFGPVDAAFLVDAAGEPVAWGPSSPSGYSDHLPILLVLERRSK